jgi:hypothetical protein
MSPFTSNNFGLNSKMDIRPIRMENKWALPPKPILKIHPQIIQQTQQLNFSQ